MGITYDFRCLTCQSDMGMDDVYHPDILAVIWAARDAALAADEAGFDVAPSTRLPRHPGFGFSLDWMREHRNHVVRVRREDGEFVNGCNLTVVCDKCHQNRGPCVREPNHHGSCST